MPIRTTRYKTSDDDADRNLLRRQIFRFMYFPWNDVLHIATCYNNSNDPCIKNVLRVQGNNEDRKKGRNLWLTACSHPHTPFMELYFPNLERFLASFPTKVKG